MTKINVSLDGEETIIIGTCDCLTCDAEYDFERSGAEHTDQCPKCAAKEEALAAAEEEREEAISDAEGELTDVTDELDGLMDELEELKSKIAAAKAAKKSAEKRLAKLQGA